MLTPEEIAKLITPAALHAARTLMKHYEFVPKGHIAATERNIALIIDICSGLYRIQRGLEQVCRQVRQASPRTLKEDLDNLKEAVEAIEYLRRRLPRYDSMYDNTLDESQLRELDAAAREITLRR